MAVWDMDLVHGVRSVRTSQLVFTEALNLIHIRHYRESTAREFVKYAKTNLNVIIHPRDIELLEKWKDNNTKEIYGYWKPKTTRVRFRGGAHAGKYCKMKDMQSIYNGLRFPSINQNAISILNNISPWSTTPLSSDNYQLSGWSEGNRCWILEKK